MRLSVTSPLDTFHAVGYGQGYMDRTLGGGCMAQTIGKLSAVGVTQ
jgi:5-formyltetrahydrofolate cyclo-ligase